MAVRLSAMSEPLSDVDKVRLHARIIEDSEQAVLITDAEERIVSINSSFSRITGYSPAEAIGRTPDLLRSGVHDPDFRAKVRAAMRGPRLLARRDHRQAQEWRAVPARRHHQRRAR